MGRKDLRHFHCAVIGGVFDANPKGGVVFHAATGLETHAVAPALPHAPCPHPATPAPAPARKRQDKRAEQPLAPARRRLTRPAGASTLRRARFS